ncbi:hypothetical protein QBC45DRAFT_186810 [Copromyces sp. CBS 386.78]|nr:hypothetical protein QBC45DRAFT_186810 [Copromyces sp. CBS 386.78]
MFWRKPLPTFTASTHFVVHNPLVRMATDVLSNKALAVRTTSSTSTDSASSQDGASFDIVKTYRSLLSSDPDMTMPVAAIESLIELLRVTPSSTAMETVEVVKTQKALLLDSAPNPLPLLAGADLFEQYLLRSLRGQTVESFDETKRHLLKNRQLFAARAKAARDNIAVIGSKYISDRKIVLAAGGSRVVTKILVHAAASRPDTHFKVIYVMDGSPHCDASVSALREAGLEVETISTSKVAYVLKDQKDINLVLVGSEVVMQNGGIISRMGTSQLALLTRFAGGSQKRFFAAAESHKIVRKTPLWHPQVLRVGVKQKDISKFDNVGVDPVGQEARDWVADRDEVDYTDPDLIDGIVTEQGVKQPSQIWELVDYEK